MPPPSFGLHDDDQLAVAKTQIRTAQLCVRDGTNERVGICGYGPPRGELSAAPS